MEAELLTVLGRIPAPDDRDLATQLTNIERSEVTLSLGLFVCGLMFDSSTKFLCRTKNRELQACQEQFQKGRLELSRLQAQLEETE